MKDFLNRVKNILWNNHVEIQTWFAIEKLLDVVSYPFDWIFYKVSPTVGWFVYGSIVGFVAPLFPICYLYGLVSSLISK